MTRWLDAALEWLAPARLGRRGRILRAGLWAATILACALFCWTLAESVGAIQKRRVGFDFHDYYFTAKAVLSKGASVYDHRAMERLSRQEERTTGLPVFVYPPLLVVLFLPLAKLSYVQARVIWLLLNQVFLLVSAFGFARLYGASGGRRPSLPGILLFTFAAGFAFAPMRNHDAQGQSNLLVLAFTSWALYFHLRREPNDRVTGMLLAPAILLKVFPGIFVPYFIARRRFAAALWTSVFGVAITLATLPMIPLSDYLRFPQVLFGSMYLSQGGGTWGNHSMEATARWFCNLLGVSGLSARPAIAAIRYLPLPILLVVAALEHRREHSRSGLARLVPALRISQATLLMGFIMAKWWEHHLVLLLLPYFLLGALLFGEGLRWRALTGLYLVSLIVVAAVFHPVLWSALHTSARAPLLDAAFDAKRVGLLLLFGTLELTIWKLKRAAPRGSARSHEDDAGHRQGRVTDHPAGELVVERALHGVTMAS